MTPARRRLRATLLLLAGLALAAACGGSSGGPARSPSPDGGGGPRACAEGRSASDDDLTIYGADANDFLADRFSLAAGDFNDDGRDDILVGAPLAEDSGDPSTNSGEAYVIFGDDDLGGEIDLASAEAGLTVFGESAGDNLGFTVAAGDVNGDGVDDVLVGARFAAAGDREGAGEAYVMFGGAELGGTIDTAAGDPDVTVSGRDSGDFLTIALAAGDVDGDGIDDLLLGAGGDAGPSNTRPGAGAAYVVRGSADLPAEIDLAAEDAYFTAFGAAADDSLPNHMAAGDLDGDGSDEMIVGAPAADGSAHQIDAGRAYLVSLPAGGGLLDLSLTGATTIIGAAQRDGLGFYTAAADLNDDGLADAIIGARDADSPGGPTNVGFVHVVFAGDNLPSTIDLSRETTDLTVSGADANDSLGFTVGQADLNGDGVADLLAGAPIGDGCDNAADAGEVYALFGRSGWPEVVDLAAARFDLAFFGEEAGDEMGFSLAAGDFNGDGRDDTALGALLADGPANDRPDAGQVHVFLGRP